ncbi:MAG TPA: c-type cytochrome [Gemmatimonadales bacterium]
MPRIIALIAALAACSTSLSAQFPPRSLENVQVFPPDTPPRELVNAMRQITMDLGVRCVHCHVGEEGQPLSTFDFASDEKRTKETARAMLRMVAAINETHLGGLAERPEPHVDVTCATCHRGLPRPQTLGQTLRAHLDTTDMTRTVEHYRLLRDRYFGSGSYDFGESSLSELGQQLIAEERPSDALAMLALNAEYFPESASLVLLMGDAFAALADTVRAIARYEDAILKDERLRGLATRRITALRRDP